jgi:AcrR family transcriptional regulator
MRGHRLGPAEWVNAGLKRLAKSGFAILKADALAKTLGITRGSFYWHFVDVSAFHAAILRRWREIALENIIEEIDAAADDRLETLLYRAFSAAGSDIEGAVRAWATADPRAKAAVEAVDAERLRYLRKLLIEVGLHANLAGTRAGIIYWSYLGFVLSPNKPDRAFLKRAITDLTQLARSNPRQPTKPRSARRPRRRMKRAAK